MGCAFANSGGGRGFAIVACAAVAERMHLRLAVGGVADRPIARDLAQLDGEALDERSTSSPGSSTPATTSTQRSAIAAARGAASAAGDSRSTRKMPRLSKAETSPSPAHADGRAVEGEAEPRLLLTDFLAHVLGATGTHVGCEHACAEPARCRSTACRPPPCLTLCGQRRRALRTVEVWSRSPDGLSGLQAAFRRHHALQCGFCTAGS